MRLLLPLALCAATPALASGGPELPDYRTLFDPAGPLGWLDSRVIIWVLAQLHLLFAAFVLAVPMFVLIIEVVGLLTKDPERARRFDALGYDFIRVAATAFSVTAIFGAVFTFFCLGLYPKMMNYMVEVFGPTMYLYSLMFFGESFCLYVYYYGWHRFQNRWAHVGVGLLLNLFGLAVLCVANAWTTFPMAPAGVAPDGTVLSRWDAFFNPLLMAFNVHRGLANLCFGGSVAAAYGAYRFLSTTDPKRRAHYDWMGYVGNLVAIAGLLPLPFAGYIHAYDVYLVDQQLGIFMMSGAFSWVFIMQAVLIGALFLGTNYYLWLGMDRVAGAERYRGWVKFMLAVIAVCVMVWATPNSLVLNADEIRGMGGTKHPVFSILGVMSAKNTAVNLVILTTFLSFVLYRRANLVPTVSWARQGKIAQVLLFAAAAAVVVVIGVGGYLPGWWLESSKRIAMSPYQMVAVGVCMAAVLAIDVPLFRGAKKLGEIRWGQVSVRSQYTLIFLAVSFTWLMSLMGFVRAGIRQHYHVYKVLEDTSRTAFTPSIGYATNVITVVVLIFFGIVAAIFWVASLPREHTAEA